jgi:serine/threonine-protein kinase RsbW/stage II sporulation protein AB (anti-sigma F factor)
MTPVPTASWSIAAEAENIAPVRQAVVEFMVENGFAELQLTDVRLAVSEAVTNAVVHAFREQREPGTVTVVVDVAADDGHVEVLVSDGGSGMAPRDDSPGVGLGLPLIRRVTDGFDHRERAGGGTELWMSFELTR